MADEPIDKSIKSLVDSNEKVVDSIEELGEILDDSTTLIDASARGVGDTLANQSKSLIHL